MSDQQPFATYAPCIECDLIGRAACPEHGPSRMTPKQLAALRMLNDAFESHDGRPVDQAVIAKADYRLLFEALAEGTAGDRIAQELLSPPSATRTTPAAIEPTIEWRMLHDLISHWREFGPEHGYDEKIESFAKHLEKPHG